MDKKCRGERNDAERTMPKRLAGNARTSGLDCVVVAAAGRMNAPCTGEPNEERDPGVRSDGVERWLRETRGLIIFEDHPRLSVSLPSYFVHPERVSIHPSLAHLSIRPTLDAAAVARFCRNNGTVIIFTFGPFTRIPHNWPGPPINCRDR